MVIPKGKGYRKALCFALDLGFVMTLVPSLFVMFGEHLQIGSVVIGFVLGSAVTWGLKSAFEKG